MVIDSVLEPYHIMEGENYEYPAKGKGSDFSDFEKDPNLSHQRKN